MIYICRIRIYKSISFPVCAVGILVSSWSLGEPFRFCGLLSILTINLYKSASKGSADVDKGCRIIARALRSKKLANKAASAHSPASLPPTSSYMTSSLGRAEVPQAVLLSICSRSPVCHVIWVCVTKRSFISCSKVSLIHSYTFLPWV